MPHPRSTGRSAGQEVDEVDEYIRSRRLERARRAAASSGLDVLNADAEFTWEMPGDRLRGGRSRGGVVEVVLAPGELLEPEADDAWRAAAEARRVSPRADEESLDEWGARMAAGREPQRRAIDAGEPGRRTIVITGRGSERSPSPRRARESSLRPYERVGFKPDRIAMWAVLLCLALLLGAAASSHAAVLCGHALAGLSR